MIYKCSIIDRGGGMKWADPDGAVVRVQAEKVREMADNAHVIDVDGGGVNSLVIASYPGRWHIIQVAGYTPEKGLFCVIVDL